MDLQQLRALPAPRAILEERARALARADDRGDAEGGEVTLTFLLGGATYALPAAAVREVQPLGAVTPLPAVPAFVVGLVNVRGRLVAALDIRPLLDIPTALLAPSAMLLIVGPDDAAVGLVADRMVAVRRASLTLAPTPSSAAGRGLAWVRGVDVDLNLHLDLSALLADPRLIVHEEAETQ
jgi:purine-binding chemotaxis protein CheW